MTTVLVVAHTLISILVILLILLHSGKDAGLSGAFGVGAASSTYGGSSAVVEKNLTRITIVVGVIFFLTTYLLVKNY
ncbi:MAG: preprotein translocase subunit SecG [Thermoleophilia bacterium]|nr:preprotein translocase subunit SecG [Thermoleophilia bacterium]